MSCLDCRRVVEVETTTVNDHQMLLGDLLIAFAMMQVPIKFL